MKSLEFFKKWRQSAFSRQSLDSLLSEPPNSQTDLNQRLDWLIDLLQWIRSEGTIATNEFNFDSGEPQVLRVKYLLQVLDRNSDWKILVADTLRSIIFETSALEILVNTGIPQEEGLVSEFFYRLSRKLVSSSHHDKSLARIFTQTFRRESDVFWISLLDDRTFSQLVGLFLYQPDIPNKDWNSLRSDTCDALLILAAKIKSVGISQIIRNRASVKDFKQLPFYSLPNLIESFVSAESAQDRQALQDQILETIVSCRKHLAEVFDHLDDFGVDISVVFKLEVLEAQLKRVEVLVSALSPTSANAVMIQNLLADLILENLKSLSLSSLLGSNLSLISRKIVERSAKTGEHYITRTPLEYLFIIKKALGGGLVTGITTLVKLVLYSVSASPMGLGLLSTLNYSISFIAIQLAGFTLATKQPAMTAPALAAKMHRVLTPPEMSELIDEIIFLIRSQLAAVAGNIVGVVPMVLFIDLIYHSYTGMHLMDSNDADYTVSSFSLLGMTPIYAAFTGVLLWLSSIFSGWADNWAKFHRLSESLRYNRRLLFTFGEKKMSRISRFIDDNFQGFAGNLSLAFMLGMFPHILKFVGVPLDVRHVTLSSGSLAAAANSVSDSLIHDGTLIWAILGVVSMAILNLSVSFSLAMLVAIRARKIKAPVRSEIYQALWTRLKKHPFILFYPRERIEP